MAGVLLMSGGVLGQTTGKISGRITDFSTGNPLPGVNLIIPGTFLGAATDPDGYYYLINLPPGEYDIQVSMIGYKPVLVKDVRVSVNRTTPLDLELEQSVIEGESVLVEVERISVKKDQTGSIKNVSAEDIAVLPIENISEIIGMQAGVVEGHFRGGRLTEVSYMIDGIQVDEIYDGNSSAIDIQPEAVQDFEVITGTFNAEYGRAMSGVVNAVTREGSERFSASVSAANGNFITKNKDIFIGLRDNEFNRNQDYKFQLSGPLLSERISFFTNFRYQDNKNHLNGLRLFNVTDVSNYYVDEPMMWYSQMSGDSAYVSLNGSRNLSALAKLTFKIFSKIKFSLLYSMNDDVWSGYNHIFKYNPDGMASNYRVSKLYAFQLNHMLSNKLFYELKLSRTDSYYGWYLYEDPLDVNYIHDRYLDSYGPGFFTGGQEKGHSERWTITDAAKADLTWQATKRHSFKTGLNYSEYTVDNKWHTIRNLYDGTAQQEALYEPVIYGDSTIYADVYEVKPTEISAYFQDKMEFENMVLNVGLRYDEFDPNTTVPTDRRNPANQLDLPDSMSSDYVKVKSISQFSPRLGLAYQLGGVAVLHFSYGHFFQMPPLYSLYNNHSLLVGPTDYETLMGNPELKPEKTVAYEIGLWQELFPGMGLEVSLFYKDIYNLLSTKIISTYNAIEYGLYSNKDYGNARGLEVKLDYATGNFRTNLNYTLQYTKGNADYPTQAFDRSGDSQDPVNKFIPMSWDQRHTLNVTFGYHAGNFGFSSTTYYNSGTPFTFTPQEESTLSRINLYPNNDYKPSRYTVDLMSYYMLNIGSLNLSFELSVYNLLDRLNEIAVNNGTGRAYTAVIRDTDRAGHRSVFNTYEDIIQNPSMYSAPRLIKFGVGVNF